MAGSNKKSKKSKKSKNFLLKFSTFILSLFCFSAGIYFFTLKYVPQKLYQVQNMRAGMKEAYYVSQWCRDDFGKREFVLWDGTRVDCLAKDYAIEFDFAKKWAESIGQSLYYAKLTHKKPAVVLILTSIEDYKYVKRIERLENGIKIFLIKAY